MPRTCSEGGASHILPVSIPVLCFLPEDAPDSPGDASGFPRGVRYLPCFTCSHLQQKQLSQADVGHQPFLCPSPHAQSRWRRRCCKVWMCFTIPRTWAEYFPVLPPVLYREPIPACPSGSFFSMEGQGGLCSPACA